MTHVPPVLIGTYSRWQSSGRPAQVRSRWNVEAWARRLPEYESLLRSFPHGAIGRQHGIDRVGKVTDEDSAVSAFLLSMIWGYGPVGYGPFRTRRVLNGKDASSRLLAVAQIAQTDGGLRAFEHVVRERKRDREYLKFLGPAFGTKYLYFLTAAMPAVETTPVMDAVVERWFRKNVTGSAVSVFQWQAESYASFLGHLREWSRTLTGSETKSLELDDVEYLIFASGANFENSRDWSEEWQQDREPLTVSDLLDQLRLACGSESQSHFEALELIGQLESVLSAELDTASPHPSLNV